MRRSRSPAREFALLHELMREPGRTRSRQELLEQVWGSDAWGRESNLVDVYIGYLRRKIDARTGPGCCRRCAGRGTDSRRRRRRGDRMLERAGRPGLRVRMVALSSALLLLVLLVVGAVFQSVLRASLRSSGAAGGAQPPVGPG